MDNNMNSPQVPISCGELFDKITILQIKLENLTSKDALENVEREFKQLRSIFIKYFPESAEAKQLEEELKQINQQLWDIEDKIRDKETGLLMMSLSNLLVVCILSTMNVLVSKEK